MTSLHLLYMIHESTLAQALAAHQHRFFTSKAAYIA